MSNPEKDQAARLERARQIGLFRYMLIREAADATLTGRQRGALVRTLAAQAHTDPDGRSVRITRWTLDRWIQNYRAGGFDALVLTNAMKPLRKLRTEMLALRERYGDRLTIRVSLDHYDPAIHEQERGRRSWAPALDGLIWLARNGFRPDVAGRRFTGETEQSLREGYATLFATAGIAVDAYDPVRLMLFPEMEPESDVPEITTACWGILHKSPDDVMCAGARMVVKRKDASAPVVLACTLLAYDPRFEMGTTLAEASGPVSLNHPFCASFCVLGGASCSR